MSHPESVHRRPLLLLDRTKTIAVVGASSNPSRPSHGIFQRLLAHGYTVIPVNPMEKEVLGQKAYPSLEEVPVPIDIVDVFRTRRRHAPHCRVGGASGSQGAVAAVGHRQRRRSQDCGCR